jgi:hypothetical protein
MKLTPAQEEELKFLRKQVDNYERQADESRTMIGDTMYNAAQVELKIFVEGLRKKGHTI